MEHNPKFFAQMSDRDPMGAAIRQGSRRGRVLHGQAVRRACRALFAGMLLMLRRSRTRRALARLDGRMLRDVGIASVDAVRESRKPLWRV